VETIPAPVDQVMTTFEELHALAWAPVLRFLRASAAPGTDLDDVAAAAFEVAWRRRDELPALDVAVPWMLGVAANVARNHARSARRVGRLRQRIAEQVDVRRHAPPCHEDLLAGEPGPATRALARLRAADREVLVLHAWEELEPTEIANVLGIDRAAAAQRLHRARKRLEAELVQEDPS
jgi:RNA polymerase sigma-70 factor (ECF subfamily)